ncbi:hypothetical protein GPECTOR_311g852 [Gonium pectorale]|uniref:cellulase n=1 Tax=Gonium pectorale TaxID=33097 RepID=A0A150FVS2_GONPE|nr:hypothetical protein GPECTOR_311g852 [Gonium pectorale]|eukprot:KXZ41709.1 hypothetical protein GPECTOR_311g852 [Gonium pectorale]
MLFLLANWAGRSRFYEAQQSGSIASWNSITWKNASHLTDGYSSSGETSDYYPGVDLSGGLYENGGHVKVSLTTAAAASLLALNGLAYSDIDAASSATSSIRQHVGWAASYLDKAFYAADKFVAQIGDAYTDDRYWGRPERQSAGGDEGSDSWRPVYTIDTDEGRGADVLSQAAAALASYATLLTKAGNSSGDATHYRDRAMAMWALAKDLVGVYIVPEGNITLLSRSYRDDQAWAAAWLCRYQIESGFTPTTEDYCASAESYWYEMTSLRGSQLFLSADVMHLAVAALLRDTMGRSETYLALNETLLAEFNTALDAAFSWWTSASDTACSCADVGLCKTPGGFMVLQEHGSAHFAANMAMLALLTAKTQTGLGAANQLSNAQKFERRCWAYDQIDYLLGGKTGQAYVVGLSSLSGVDASISSPKRPRHRASSCEKASGKCYAASLDNVYELQGALVGGPKKDDSYSDSRNSFQSLVSIEYNAGFAGALLGLGAVEAAMAAAGGSWPSWSTFCGNSGVYSTVLTSSDSCSATTCADTSIAADCGLRSDGATLTCNTLYSADLDLSLTLASDGPITFNTVGGASGDAYTYRWVPSAYGGSSAVFMMQTDGSVFWRNELGLEDVSLYVDYCAMGIFPCEAESIVAYQGTGFAPFSLSILRSATDKATLLVTNKDGNVAFRITYTMSKVVR